MVAGDWTWLEISKLLVSLLTPLIVAGVGIVVARAARSAEQAQIKATKVAEDAEWRNRRAVDRLLELHAAMAPLMNDLICVLATIGDFRDIDPPTLIAKKRQLDKLYFVNEHLFSHEFRQAYAEYIEQCFEHWMSPGEDAKIRMSAEWLRGERGGRGWEPGWQQLLIDEPGVDESLTLKRRQKESYGRAMEAFARQLGLGEGVRRY